MEINSVIKNEYSGKNTEVNLRETFESEKYISIKPESSGFFDIKLKIKEIIENIISPKEQNLKDELNEMFLDLDFGSEFNINADKIGVQDAIFFVNLLNQNNIINYSVDNNEIKISTDSGKTIEVTNSLLKMLETSVNTKKPIRLDFDKDVTVILKLDKEGKIQAHFIPGTSEVESYLKNNLHCLKQRFDDENINYSQLGYSKYKDENNSRKKRSNK